MAEMEDMEVEQAAPAPDVKGKGRTAAGGKRFEIKKWNAVAMWSWAICTDTCAICRNNLYEPSIEYQARRAGPAPHACAGRAASLGAGAAGAPALPRLLSCMGLALLGAPAACHTVSPGLGPARLLSEAKRAAP